MTRYKTLDAGLHSSGGQRNTPFRVDTNSLFITERLNTIGFDVRIKTVVGDDVGIHELVRASRRGPT
jgi:hypothetical protein